MTANLKDMLTKTEPLKYPYKRVNILYEAPPFHLFLWNYSKTNRWIHKFSIIISFKASAK